MYQPSKSSEADSSASHAMPFMGLGHCLECVRTVSSLMKARWATQPAHEPIEEESDAQNPRPSGYGLLVRLGREIRGQ